MTDRIIGFFRYLVFRERSSYYVKEPEKKRIRENIIRIGSEKMTAERTGTVTETEMSPSGRHIK